MPTAFISYSWDSDAHKEWVLRFASDLRSSGVKVLLDRWEVRLGDDVTQFMEQGVANADFVILVCTEAFATKANNRSSGVGYEQAIVTAALLNGQPVRGRFVCVLRSGVPSSAIPVYMQTRLWLDLRDERTYREGLDQLRIHLLDRSDRPILSVEQAASELTSESQSSAVAPAPVPEQWVLVAGSGVARAFSSELAALSEYVGRRLAERGFGLVTGGWFGVDETTARAFADAALHDVVALEDRLIQVIPKSKEPAFAAGQLIFVDAGEPEWTEAIRRSTCVFLLGGIGGTWKTGEIALKLGKLVLPLADTGGDAKKFYLHMLSVWEQLHWLSIDQREFQRIARPGRAAIDSAIEIVVGRKSAV